MVDQSRASLVPVAKFAVGTDFGRRSNDKLTTDVSGYNLTCPTTTDMFVFIPLQLTSAIDEA